MSDIRTDDNSSKSESLGRSSRISDGYKIYGNVTFSRDEWKGIVRKYAKLGEMYNNKSVGAFESTNSNLKGSTGTRLSSNPSTQAGTMDLPSVREPSIPKLLLNYFVTMAFEESSLRMAKELGYIQTNKDSIEFNSYYKIKERAHIIHLIKTGSISQAMDSISTVFGVEVLENSVDTDLSVFAADKRSQVVQNINSKNDKNSLSSSDESEVDTYGDDDIHFKLLLLNLIEMIRIQHIKIKSGEVTELDNKFILDLIAYSQEKLAMKAARNDKHMKELELTMTLLLFPMQSLVDKKESPKLPESLRNLYSLSLRSHVADIVNRKLLKYIVNSNLMRDSPGKEKFRDVSIIIDPRGYFLQSESMVNTNILKIKTKDEFKDDLYNDDRYKNNTKTFEKYKNEFQNEDGSNNSLTGSNSYWAETTEMLRRQSNTTSSSDNDQSSYSENDNNDSKNKKQTTHNASKNGLLKEDGNLSEFQFEPKLVQIMRLWAWTENQLHVNDIGIPRVEN